MQQEDKRLREVRKDDGAGGGIENEIRRKNVGLNDG